MANSSYNEDSAVAWRLRAQPRIAFLCSVSVRAIHVWNCAGLTLWVVAAATVSALPSPSDTVQSALQNGSFFGIGLFVVLTVLSFRLARSSGLRFFIRVLGGICLAAYLVVVSLVFLSSFGRYLMYDTALPTHTVVSIGTAAVWFHIIGVALHGLNALGNAARVFAEPP